MIVPLVFGLMMYFMIHQVYMLLFCVMSPVMMVGQWVSENREGKRKNRDAAKSFKAAMAEHEEDLEAARRFDQRERRANHPDPAEILLTATGPRRRLWERRITDPDALRLRIGLADLPADIELQPEGRLRRGRAAVGAAAGARRAGGAALPGDRRGRRRRRRAAGRWPRPLAGRPGGGAAQPARPVDRGAVLRARRRSILELGALAAALRPAAGRGLRGAGRHRPGGGRPPGQRARCQELARAARRTPAANGSGGRLRPDPYVLVVLDGARLLRGLPGMPQLLQRGAAVRASSRCASTTTSGCCPRSAAAVSRSRTRPAGCTCAARD